MSNKVSVFNFENHDVRIVDQNGEPWWVLKDVCDVLDIKQPTRVIKRLDSDEKAEVNLNHLSSNGVMQARNLLVVNESGLYNVILRSDKPEAKQFRKWITSEVLPSIRKTGGYSVSSGEIFGERARVYCECYQQCKEENRALKDQVKTLSQEKRIQIDNHWITLPVDSSIQFIHVTKTDSVTVQFYKPD